MLYVASQSKHVSRYLAYTLSSVGVGYAAEHFAVVAADPGADPVQTASNAALLAAAEGDWPRATEELERILADEVERAKGAIAVACE